MKYPKAQVVFNKYNKNYEIIIIENNSTEKETFRYYSELEKDPRIREAAAKGLSAIIARSEFGLKLLEECRDAGRIKMWENTPDETEKFLTGVAAEKPTWYGPWIEARKHRGMPVREYIL